MGQVPRKSSLLLIGNGRMVRHFLYYFSLLGYSVLHWHRGQPFSELNLLLAQADRVGLLISDGSIVSFYQEHKNWLTDKLLFHVSGALSHPEIESAHPLMTFSEPLYSETQYRQITFVLERGRATFRQLFPELDNPHVEIEPSQKPLYHALCVCAGNLVTLLQQDTLREFDNLKIPHQAVELFVRQTINNFFDRPHGSLTGPLARQDVTTVQANLDSLNGTRLQGIYRQFVTWFPEIQKEIGGGQIEHSRFSNL